MFQDPTGTIGASIHRKVFTEGEFRKDINVGSVLLLQKVLKLCSFCSLSFFFDFLIINRTNIWRRMQVAVFCPNGFNFYLNITLGNIVKVWGYFLFNVFTFQLIFVFSN